jgi:hypothetical protein
MKGINISSEYIRNSHWEILKREPISLSINVYLRLTLLLRKSVKAFQKWWQLINFFSFRMNWRKTLHSHSFVKAFRKRWKLINFFFVRMNWRKTLHSNSFVENCAVCYERSSNAS